MAKLVVGCGYLGLRVARLWVAQGEKVFAMTRKQTRATEFEAEGIEPVVGDVTSADSLVNLPDVDTVLVAVGMDRSVYSDVEAVYVGGLANLLAKLPGEPKLIYVSSTGVYGNFQGDWVNEESPTDPVRPGGKACLNAEQLIWESRFADKATVLRFAGIYGPERVPTRDAIVDGKWKKLASGGYLNLIQVDDGAAVVDRVSKADKLADGKRIYLVSDGNPVQRRDYYSYIAGRLQLPEIPWSETDVDPKTARSGSNKRISNAKLLRDFGEIQLAFPDYQAGLDHALGVKL